MKAALARIAISILVAFALDGCAKRLLDTGLAFDSDANGQHYPIIRKDIRP